MSHPPFSPGGSMPNPGFMLGIPGMPGMPSRPAMPIAQTPGAPLLGNPVSLQPAQLLQPHQPLLPMPQATGIGMPGATPLLAPQPQQHLAAQPVLGAPHPMIPMRPPVPQAVPQMMSPMMPMVSQVASIPAAVPTAVRPQVPVSLATAKAQLTPAQQKLQEEKAQAAQAKTDAEVPNLPCICL